MCLLEYGVIHLSRVRLGSNLLLVCIPNVFQNTLSHNFQAEGDGFVWIDQLSVEWGYVFGIPSSKSVLMSTPLGWQVSLRWMIFKNIRYALILRNWFSFNFVWINSSMIILSFVLWSVKHKEFGITILIGYSWQKLMRSNNMCYLRILIVDWWLKVLVLIYLRIIGNNLWCSY